MKSFRLFLVLALAMLFSGVLCAQEKVTEKWLKENYSKREVMIPMRDGVGLFTSIYEPVDPVTRKPLEGRPIIMERTPYGTAPYGLENYDMSMTRSGSIYAANKYIIVNQSVRGTFMSEGDYVQVRPLANSAEPGMPAETHVDEATDTYDSAEWLVHNTHSNGNIGLKGVSYPGFYAAMAGLSGHPAVKAVSPQAPVTDWFRGDDMHHNGAYFLADEFTFGVSFYRKRQGPTMHWQPSLVDIDGDIYEWFKRPIWDILGPCLDSLSFLKEGVSHPNFDSFWEARDASLSLRNMKPAVMVVGGLFDAEDCYGAQRMYKTIKVLSPSTDLYFVEGPWSHGGWHDAGFNSLSGSYFGENTSEYYMENIEYPFFAHYLEGKPLEMASVNVYPSFAMAVPVKKDRKDCDWPERWVSYSSWPPKFESQEIYLHDGRLSYIADAGASVTYHSDPSDPIPYYEEPTTRRNTGYMAGNQAYCSSRKDVATFYGDYCKDSFVLAGPVSVHIDASSTGTDADFIVKLIDVRPDGYQMLVRAEVMPARFRESFRTPKAITPGEKFSVDWSMNDICHVVLPGHRLMVQVQSSCFPLIAMNPQTFLENPYKAVAGDYKPSDITIYGDSFVTIPVSALPE